jgi:hypothetical protein
MGGTTVIPYRPREYNQPRFVFSRVIDSICRMAWEDLDSDELMRVATAYYFFAVQFRENLEVALGRHPDSPTLIGLWERACDTDNLSPWSDIAAPGERMNHDEFMRRILECHPAGRDRPLVEAGLSYLQAIRAIDDGARAASIASYEDDGLTRVFDAMLRARHWDGKGQRSFRFFLEKHIGFYSDNGAGYGSLSRRLPVDDRVLRLWTAFRDLLITAVPKLAMVTAVTRREPRTPVFLRPLRVV